MDTRYLLSATHHDVTEITVHQTLEDAQKALYAAVKNKYDKDRESHKPLNIKDDWETILRLAKANKYSADQNRFLLRHSSAHIDPYPQTPGAHESDCTRWVIFELKPDQTSGRLAWPSY